jgi:hypothetical protein
VLLTTGLSISVAKRLSTSSCEVRSRPLPKSGRPRKWLFRRASDGARGAGLLEWPESVMKRFQRLVERVECVGVAIQPFRERP